MIAAVTRSLGHKLEHLEPTSVVRVAASLNSIVHSHQKIDDASNRDEQERSNLLEAVAL